MRLARRLLLGLVVLAVLGYAAVVGYMFVQQRALQYSASGEITALADSAIVGAEEVVIPVGDTLVNGWYAPPREGQPLIVYYKGNSGSFTAEHERYAQWVSDGYGFLAFDYRGFPASPGEITQEHILADALAAYDWAAEKNLPMVVWGRSLGSGPATYVASERYSEALLLETPFLSAVHVAAARYPYLPVYWVMLDQFPVDQWIGDVAEPVFIAHGTADSTIGVSNGEDLYEIVPNPAGLWIVEGGEHGNLWDYGLWGEAEAFFETTTGTNENAVPEDGV